MKRYSLLLGLAAVPFIIACGGDTSDTLATATGSTATITGTVPGTLIEAFCQDGSYYSVSSTNNGTSQHPFEITVPQGVNCRLVMTTNENDPANRVITPIGFIQSDTNGTTVSLNTNVDLGYVPLALDIADINDTNNDHVSDTILMVDLNNTTGTVISTIAVMDSDNDGIVDPYEDDDGDELVNAYEDDDGDGTPNIHDDDDNNGHPDYIEDDDNDGIANYMDDDNGDHTPDYVEDDDGDGIPNHLDNN